MTSQRVEKQYSKLCEVVIKGDGKDYMYQRYVDYVLAHLYVANPQGRIQAIEELKISEYQELFQKGRVASTHFKTAGTYTYQIITACEASKK